MIFAKLVVAVGFCVFAFPLLVPAMASEEPEPRTVINDEGNNPSLNSTGSGSELPLLEKVSDNGTYLVQLAWPTLPLNPDNAFDLQVFFLNASDPRGINGTAAQPETNFTGSGTEMGGTVPETMQSVIDVESYDITIYSDDGSVLWQKLDPAFGSALIFLVPCVVLAMLSPWTIRLLSERVTHVGRVSGRIYAASTIGSIAGVFVSGYVLLDHFDVTDIIRATGGLTICLGIACVFLDHLPVATETASADASSESAL